MIDDKEKKLIYLVTSIIILALIIVVIIIWTSSFSKGNETAEITSYVDYDDGYYLENAKEKYKQIVTSCINEDNFEYSYELIDEEYLNKLNMSKDELEAYLKREKILTHPTSTSVIYCYCVRDNNEKYIYTYKYKIGNVEKQMHIIERYYGDYTISFEQDEYPIIDESIKEYKDSKTSMDFATKVIGCYDENIVYEITITNNSSEEYTFELSSVNDSMIQYTRNNQTAEALMSSIVIGEGVSNFTLEPGKTKVVKLSYNLGLKNQKDAFHLYFNNITSTNGDKLSVGIII